MFPISLAVWLAVWCVLGLVLAAPFPLGATTLSLSPTRDNTLYAGDDLSNGAGKQLFVGVNGQGQRQRALVHFDVAGSLPEDALIESASLQVAVTLTMAGAFDVNAHRLPADWAEGVYAWSSPDLLADVLLFYTQPDQNHGWLLDAITEAGSKQLGSRENGDVGQRPALIIEYSVVPEPGTGVLLGLGLIGLAVCGHRPSSE